MSVLSRVDAERWLQTVDGWILDGDAIRKTFTFPDFVAAVAFVNRLAPEGR